MLLCPFDAYQITLREESVSQLRDLRYGRLGKLPQVAGVKNSRT